MTSLTSDGENETECLLHPVLSFLNTHNNSVAAIPFVKDFLTSLRQGLCKHWLLVLMD